MSGLLALLTFSLAAGVMARRSSVFPSSTAAAINAYVLLVALPALVLRAIRQIELRADLLAAAATPWCVMAGALLLLPLLARRLGWSRATLGAVVLTAGLGNTAFVGLPMAEALLGPSGLAAAVVVDQLGSFLVLSTLGAWFAAHYSAGAPSARALALKILRFPPFLALVLAFASRPFAFPAALDTLLERLGDTLTPLALFSVGFQLTLVGARARLPALGVGLGYKLLLSPLIAFGVLHLLGATEPPVYSAAILQCAMAPMVTASVLAATHELDAPLAALMVGLGVPLSLLTAPLLLRLLS